MLLGQILAIVVFVVMFVAIVSGKVHRYIPAIVGAALTIIIVVLITLKSPVAVVSVLNLEQLFHAFSYFTPPITHISKKDQLIR